MVLARRLPLHGPWHDAIRRSSPSHHRSPHAATPAHGVYPGTQALLRACPQGPACLIQESGQHELASWIEKVAILPRQQVFVPSSIQPDILQAIYDGLLQDRQLKVHYRPLGQDARNYVLNPLGLVFRGNTIYLLANNHSPQGKPYPNALQFVLHRFEKADILQDRPSDSPAHLSLQAELRKGAFGYFKEPSPIHLVALFDKEQAQQFLESRLSEDQEMVNAPDGRVQLSATVTNTKELSWWLMGFGAHVEILEPPSLRQEMAQAVMDMYERYHGARPSRKESAVPPRGSWEQAGDTQRSLSLGIQEITEIRDRLHALDPKVVDFETKKQELLHKLAMALEREDLLERLLGADQERQEDKKIS